MPSSDKYFLKGPIGIFWDIENCAVPSDVFPENVAGNIRMALQNNPMVDGEVTVFSAFADLMSFSTRFRECFYRTGVKIVDVPNNRKEAADKAILVEMFLFALDNRPPSSIMLISGDGDFAPTLHILGQRGYNVILVIPKGVCVSSALRNAGRFVWDWPSLAHGKGFVTPCSVPGLAKVCSSPIKKYVEVQAEELKSRSECSSTPRTTFRSSESFQSTRTQPSTDKGNVAGVQPGDINELKLQLIKLLELSGGSLSLNNILNEYGKLFRRPLIFSEYGAERLIHLLEKLSDVISIRGERDNKVAFLLGCAPTSEKDKLKQAGRVGEKQHFMNGQVEHPKPMSECNTKVTFQNAKTSQPTEQPYCSPGRSVQPGDINHLKCQLVKLLKLSGGLLSLNDIKKEYAKLFHRHLIFSEYGVDRLIHLLEKLSDVIGIREENNNKAAYLLQSVSKKSTSCSLGKSVQPGDIQVLKCQLVQLLKLSGGSLSLSQVPEVYAKLFHRPLIVSEYGAEKLTILLEKLSDAIVIRGHYNNRAVCLTQTRRKKQDPKQGEKAGDNPKSPSFPNGKPFKNGSCESTETLSSSSGMSPHLNDLNDLKCQFIKLLKLSGGCLLLSRFLVEYGKLFQQPLVVSKYGATNFSHLLGKVSDAIAIKGEAGEATAYLLHSESVSENEYDDERLSWDREETYEWSS